MATPVFKVTVDPHSQRTRRLDVLRWPVVGRFLRWRHARTVLQAPLLFLAGLIVFDGLVGPQLAPKNLATTVVWLHYRGFVVLALLVTGNLFCMACPFMLPRQLGRRVREWFLGGGQPVPQRLRSKWLAVALLVAFFYAYERWSLWSSPWLTAWVVVGYFLAAFSVDTWFRGAAFCKYVCPLGQFNFVSSLVSPLEVRVREPDVCAACRTKDCITARAATAPTFRSGAHKNPSPPVQRPGARGCELWLFQPAKTGNMDCTFCLDCVHACPYDNVGLLARVPASELWDGRYRSGIGYLARRPDLAALVAVFIFAGFINAFAMIRPVYELRDRLAAWLGSGEPGLALIFLLGLGALPAALLFGAALAGRRLAGGRSERLAALVQRYVYALVPLGFSMWLAHYSYHFLTGGLTIVPVVQSFLADVGLYGGAVQWGLGPLVPLDWLYPIEAACLYLGASGSLVAALQIARNHYPDEDRSRVLRAALPWMAVCLLMLGLGLWILVQPMDMRGTFMMLNATGS